MLRRASTVVSALWAVAMAARRAMGVTIDREELHDGNHRFARLNTECRFERRQRGFIADGSHVRPMNFDQGRVLG